MANNFKVDSLVKTFKELQQEKSRLEQKLQELRGKRKGIDSENEAAIGKLSQVSYRPIQLNYSCNWIPPFLT